MSSEHPTKDDRSLGDLLSELMRETTTLVKQEVTLAKSEMMEKATYAGKKAGAVAIGAAVAYAGLLTIIAAVVLILVHLGLPAWGSALLVGIIVAAVGGFLLSKNLAALKDQDLSPRKTAESLKEDKQWVQEQMR